MWPGARISPWVAICNSVLGSNDHFFPIGVNHSQPLSQVSGGSEATHTPGGNSSKIQNHCQEPYYQAVPSGESPPAEEVPSTCLTPTKRPVAPTLLAPPPNSEPVSLLHLIHSSGMLTCTAQGPGEETQDREEGHPHCVPGK